MAETSESDRERRRGGLYFFLFFLGILLIGGLYWAWLTFGQQERPIVDPVTPPATVIPAGTDTTIETPVIDPVTPAPPPIDEVDEPDPEPEPPVVVEPPAPTPPPPEPKSLFSDARWIQTATITGMDAAGNSADFSVYLLSGANAWVFGKSGQMEIGGRVISASDLFAGSGLSSAYCDQSAVIALGAASYEGEVSLNHRLAGGRGRNLVSALGVSRPTCDGGNGPRRLSANLGAHNRTLTCPGNAERCPEVSAPQRPIVIISGTGDQASMDYGAALRNAIEAHEAAGHQIFPSFRLRDYSQFEISD